jgi:CheY-like chemotaxis protein
MAETAPTSGEHGDRRNRILIVDDHADTARMMKVLLRREGYEVSIAQDGPDAIAAARTIRPGVILLDLTMPGMSGLEVAEELRRAEGLAETVLIAVSGHEPDQFPVPSPFDAHLSKPLDHDRLVRLLKGVVPEGT